MSAASSAPRRGRLYAGGSLILLTAMTFAVGTAAFSGSFLTSVEARFGADARERLQSWASLVEHGRVAASMEDKLDRSNSFMNRVPFVADEAHWGRRDYWATPVEFLTTNGGDCEDFSIAKYTTLRLSKVEDARLRIVYVRAMTQQQPHMVLAYYPSADAEPLILDNLEEQIRPAGQRRDLVPVYSFNGEGLWQAVGRSSGRKVGTSARIAAWRDVLARMEAEHVTGGTLADPEQHGRPWAGTGTSPGSSASSRTVPRLRAAPG